MHVKIVHKSAHSLPAYATDGASGMDLRAHLEAPLTLAPMQRALVGTGIHMALPTGFEAQIRPRSGLAAKHGITVLNSPGTVDADYRGEVKVLLINLSDQAFVINDGERIAQMVIAPCTRIHWWPVATLEDTGRGEGGFGSTGVA